MRTNSPRYFRVTAKIDIIPKLTGTKNKIYNELREIQESVKRLRDDTPVKTALHREVILLRRYMERLNPQKTTKVTSCRHCDTLLSRGYSTWLCAHHRIN